MVLRGFIFFYVLIIAFAVEAAEIAFFIKRSPDGVIERYEESTPYTHVAIRVGDQWLEARPWHGVRLTQDTTGMGDIVEILHDPSVPEPDELFLNEVLGKKYFLFADWDDPETYSCTKLVAKYLDIAPNPMDFDPMIWGNRFHEFLGKRGLSVGELYSELKVIRNYEIKSSNLCLRALIY